MPLEPSYVIFLPLINLLQNIFGESCPSQKAKVCKSESQNINLLKKCEKCLEGTECPTADKNNADTSTDKLITHKNNEHPLIANIEFMRPAFDFRAEDSLNPNLNIRTKTVKLGVSSARTKL